jgi:hypothetical protein
VLIDDRNHDDIVDKGAKYCAPDLGQEHGSVGDLDCFISSWPALRVNVKTYDKIQASDHRLNSDFVK